MDIDEDLPFSLEKHPLASICITLDPVLEYIKSKAFSGSTGIISQSASITPIILDITDIANDSPIRSLFSTVGLQVFFYNQSIIFNI